MKLAILCPITSRGCSTEVEEQPIFKALIPSMFALNIWRFATLYLAYDYDDPIWSQQENRLLVPSVAKWVECKCEGLTSVWNEVALTARSSNHEYFIPANDDLVFETSPFPAMRKLAKQKDFGTVAFSDYSCPDLPTFFLVGLTHFKIFGKLYPLPWEGAHQDSWIHDVYSPWKKSEIYPVVRCKNHVSVGTRFDYGPTNLYKQVVLEGRHKVNSWLSENPGYFNPLNEEVFMATEHCIENVLGGEDQYFRAQCGEDKWLNENWDKLGLPDKGIFVDFGAGNGERFSNSFWLEKVKGWSGILCEPNPWQEMIERPNSIIERVAVGPNKTIRLGMTADPDLASELRKVDSVEGEPRLTVLEWKDVECVPLSTILKKHQIAQIDVLSIDTEGTEIEAWRTLDLNRWRPQIVIVEYSTWGIGNALQQIKDIKRVWQNDGYELLHTTTYNCIFKDKK